MRDFQKCTPDRQYEAYCPSCKRKELLPWEEIKWLQVYQRVGQNPRYSCTPCTQARTDAGITWMQVRIVRQKAEASVKSSEGS